MMRRSAALPLVWTLACLCPVSAAEVGATSESTFGDVSLVSETGWTEAVSRRRQRVETAPQPVVVLGAEDLVNTPAITLADRLRYVPGIDVYQGRHGQFDVGIHGYNGIANNRMLVLYDNQTFALDQFGATFWVGAVPVSDIETVEIVKGPSSVTYGANAFGGVVALRGREAGAQHQMFGQALVGTDATRDADVTVLGPLGPKVYYKASAGGSHLGDWTGASGYADYQPNARTADTGDTDLRSNHWRGVMGVRLPADHRLEVDYRGLDLREWDFINDLVNGAGRAQVRQDDLGGRLAGRWGEIRYDRTWARKDYSNEKSEYVPAPPGYVPVINQLVNGYPAYDDFHYIQSGFDDGSDHLRAQASQGVGTHFLSVGGELTRSWSRSNLWSNTGAYADDATWQQVTTYNRAAFAEDQWSLTPAWTLTAGGRVDDHSQAGVNASPRMAANYAQGSDQFWRVSYSSGYRLPTDIETHLRQYYFRSDEDLQAEKLHEVDLGWSRRLGNDAKLSINGFYSYGKDLIWLQPLPESEMAANWGAWLASGPNPTQQPGPFFTYANQSIPAETTGIDVAGDCRIDGTPVTLFANGTWQRMRYRESIIYQSNGFTDPLTGATMFRFHEDLGRDINAPPEWKANLGARAEYGHLFASTVGRWVDSRRVLSFAYSNFPAGTVCTQEIPSYAALDGSVGWDFDGNATYRRFVRLSVLDLFDSAHYEVYQASPEQLRTDYNRQYSSEVGRAVTLQVGMAW